VTQRFTRTRVETPAPRCLIHKALAWCSLTGVAVVVATIAGWWLSAAPSLAAGTAANITLTLLPSKIPADGSTTTTAIATVTDDGDNPVAHDDVVFSGISGPYVTRDDGDGTYATTIRSTTSPGQATITAADMSVVPTLSATATLTQEAVSTIVLSVAPTESVTNQEVTMTAVVVVASGGSPSGTMTFANRGIAILGCAGLILAPSTGQLSTATSTCQTSFATAGSPEQLTAAFVPTAGDNTVGSTGKASLPVSAGTTSTSLAVSKSR